MEVEEMYIVWSQAKVVGLDGASLQGPSVPARWSSRLDQPQRRPLLKALFEVAAGLVRIPETGDLLQVLRAEIGLICCAVPPSENSANLLSASFSVERSQ